MRTLCFNKRIGPEPLQDIGNNSSILTVALGELSRVLALIPPLANRPLTQALSLSLPVPMTSSSKELSKFLLETLFFSEYNLQA